MNPEFDFKYGNTELRFIKEVRDVSDLYSVYEIRCINNNRVYIGQTRDINKRFANHKYHLSVGDHDNIYLQSDFNKYNSYSFKYTVLKECHSRAEAKQFEDYYIEKNGGIESNKVYNQQDNKRHNVNYNNKLKMSALNNPNYGNRGKHMSKITKNKLSEIKKLQWKNGIYTRHINNKNVKNIHLSDEHKQKISKSLKGRVISEEHKQKISDSLKGREFTIERKANLSKSKIGKPSKLKGIPRTAETRQKLSDNARINPNYGMKGKKLSIEARKKISENNKKRKKYSDEFIQEIRSLRNKGLTCKQIANMYNKDYSVINRLLNHGTSHPI